MKNISLLLLCLLWSGVTYSQSTGYKAQSDKIKSLVEQRNAKFDQYQSILSKKSGIFGGKTKKDIQSSVDVLTEIVQTDNTILEETETLLKTKPVEPKRSSATSASRLALKAYQDSVAQLQQKNISLSQKANSLERQKRNNNIILFILGLISLALLLPSLVKKK